MLLFATLKKNKDKRVKFQGMFIGKLGSASLAKAEVIF